MHKDQHYLLPTPPQPAIRNAMAKVAEREANGLPVIDFTSGNVGKLPFNMNLFPKIKIEVNKNIPRELQIISDAIASGLNDSFSVNPVALSYSPAGGTASIKRLVTKYFRNVHNIPLNNDDFDRVIVTPGGQRCMTNALRSLKPSTKVFLSRWEYSAVSAIIKEHGCKIEKIGCNDDLSLNLKELHEKIEENSVFYISMPNNPSGYVSAKDLEQIASCMTKHDGGVIWDAPYI